MKRVIGASSARLSVLSAFLLLSAVTTGAQDPSAGQANIGVQGHWVIEVHNPDGTLVKRHEFNNALASPNGHILVRMMSRLYSPGYWYVSLLGTASLPSPCGDGTSAGQRACVLQEPGDGNFYSGSSKFPVLSVSTDTGANFPTKLILSGTFTAEATGNITRVSTGNGICSNTVAPASPCANGAGYQFTNHDFIPNNPPPVGPIPIQAGQVVQVRVEISFSSASST